MLDSMKVSYHVFVKTFSDASDDGKSAPNA